MIMPSHGKLKRFSMGRFDTPDLIHHKGKVRAEAAFNVIISCAR